MIDTIDPQINVFDTEIDINALGQSLDSTWGRSSTPKNASYSVKFSISGGCLQASYAAIVNFATEREMIEMKRRYSEECKGILDSLVKHVIKNYKDLCDKTLKIKEKSRSDSVEVISNSVNNPKRTAYYRCKVLYDLAG